MAGPPRPLTPAMAHGLAVIYSKMCADQGTPVPAADIEKALRAKWGPPAPR